MNRNIFQEIRNRGHDEDFQPKSVSAPTDYLPGSREKVETLAARVESGVDLFHPDDATYASFSEQIESRAREKLMAFKKKGA